MVDSANEVEHRMNSFTTDANSNPLRPQIVKDLKDMFDEHNVLAKIFRSARDRVNLGNVQSVKIKLMARRTSDGREYDLPTVDEQAGLIVDETGEDTFQPDIVVQYLTNAMERVKYTHSSLMALQYPILFPYGEDEWHGNIQLRNSNSRRHLSQCDFYAYRIQIRLQHQSHILLCGKLFQQYVVNAYALVEAERLDWIRDNQWKLRKHYYNGLVDAMNRGDTDLEHTGKRIILAASHTGSPRCKFENFQDAMAICRSIGFPDLFITFTCDVYWPEIQYMTDLVKQSGRRDPNRADVTARVFKLKLNQLMYEVKKKGYIRQMYRLCSRYEFQKRGLPHAHILLFLSAEDKIHSTSQIDSAISAEIPDSITDPQCYAAVANYMFHGPCGALGPNAPCTVKNKCTKHFPKQFNSETSIDEDGFPRYKRSDNEKYISKKGVQLDNRYVVPYNRYLLLRFDAHINVEYCNKSRAIKYLFKYINKPPDRAAATIVSAQPSNLNSSAAISDIGFVDEIKAFMDCRYITPGEACWRLFKFELYNNNPSVQRLSYHLPGQQPVFSTMNSTMDELLEADLAHTSMLLEWMERNKHDSEARKYTFLEFPKHYVWSTTRKTFLWQVISLKLRSEKKVVICVATSGIAALLMTGGRTAHSRFHIPVDVNEISTCHIELGSELAEMIENTSLIIWDEAPMTHKHCIESLDRTLRDVMSRKDKTNADVPFGGITVVFGGDFRQILPIIPKATRTQIVNSSIKRLYLWQYMTVIRLTENMRLRQLECTSTEATQIADFSNWILEISNGVASSIYGDADIEIPADLIIDNKVDPVIAIVEETYTQLSDNIGNADYFAGRAILAPFHETVSQINNYMLDQFPGEEMCYYNYDSIQSDCVNSSTAEDEFPLEFLNSLQIGNFPDHQLKLKVGVPVILLRNLDQTTGLCNGTRMVIRTLGTWFIEVEILMGTHVGERVYLPRLSLTSKQKSLDFTLVRRQYPIALSFAMTINKSQGQTLHSVGLCLKRQVFTHDYSSLLHSTTSVRAKRCVRSKNKKPKVKICPKAGGIIPQNPAAAAEIFRYYISLKDPRNHNVGTSLTAVHVSNPKAVRIRIGAMQSQALVVTKQAEIESDNTGSAPEDALISR
ncbi:ATP-dependent DNA helicase PIF1 [Linum perenne]